MDLEHTFTIPVPPEQAWRVLLDVERMAPCMPGATVESVTDDVVTGRIKVKVGPVTMTYSGTAKFVARDEETRTVTLEASGKETRGGGTAAATVRSSLTEEDGKTRVVVRTSLNVTGRPAQFGRGVLAEVGSKVIERFAANLAAQLAEPEVTTRTNGSAPRAESGREASANGTGTEVPVPRPADFGRQTLTTPIEDLNLPVRAFNSLRREGIHTVGDLSARSETDLLGITNLGPQSVHEIQQKLSSLGLSLSVGEEVPTADAVNGTERLREEPVDPETLAHPTSLRPPDEEAIDLLSVAGFPVAKRVVPAVCALVAVLLLLARSRGAARRGLVR